MKKILTIFCILFLFAVSIFGQMWTQPGSGFILNGAVRSMITLPVPNQNQMIWAGLFTQAGSINSPKLINYNASSNSYTAINGTNNTFDINGFYIGPDGLVRAFGKGNVGGIYYGVFKFTTPTTLVPDTYFQFTGSNASNQKIEAADCNGSETIIAGRNLSEINGITLTHAGQVSNSGVVTNKSEIDAGTAEIKRIVYDPTASNYKIAGQFTNLGSTNSPKFAIFDGFTVTPVSGASDGTSYCVDYDYNNERIGWTNNFPSSGGGDLMISTANGFSSSWLVLTQDILEYQGETFFIGFPKGASGPNRSAIASWNGSFWTDRGYNLQNTNPPSNSGILCGAVADGCLFVGGNLAPPNSECFIVAKLCLSGALAVKYDYLKGKDEGKNNLLFWKTSKEVNNSGFKIFSSNDGENFDSIGFVKGTGNSPSEYEFLDENPREVTHYKLKQIDYDGKSFFTDVIKVVNKNIKSIFKIYPNPVSDVLNIDLPENFNGEIILQNSSGQNIFVKSISNDEISMRIDVSEFEKGIYFIKIGEEITEFTKL